MVSFSTSSVDASITDFGNFFFFRSSSSPNLTPSDTSSFKSLPENLQTKLKLPYVQTSLLVNELINLTHDTSNGLIKVKEKSGMRKDRYSSLEYGYYVVQELSKKLKPKSLNSNLLSQFIIRPAVR